MDNKTKEVVLETTSNWINEGYVGTFLGMSVFTPAGWAAWRLIKSKFDKCEKKCGTFDFGPKRDICMLICKSDKLKKQIESLKKSKSNCKDLRNSKKCKDKIDKSITSKKEKLNKYKRRITDLKKKKVSENVEVVNEVAIMAVSAILSAAIVGGTKIFRNYMSRAAKACSGLKGNRKSNCMSKFQINALKAQIRVISNNKKYCRNSESPLKCRNRIDNQVYKLKLKIRTIQDKEQQYA